MPGYDTIVSIAEFGAAGESDEASVVGFDAEALPLPQDDENTRLSDDRGERYGC